MYCVVIIVVSVVVCLFLFNWQSIFHIKSNVVVEELLISVIDKYIKNFDTFNSLFLNDKKYFLQNETKLFYKKYFKYSNASYDKYFKSIDFYQKYDDSLILNVRYKDSNILNIIKKRYEKFIKCTNNFLSSVELLNTVYKKFGTQYIHYVSFNGKDYSIVYNNHDDDLNYIKIVVFLIK